MSNCMDSNGMWSHPLRSMSRMAWRETTFTFWTKVPCFFDKLTGVRTCWRATLQICVWIQSKCLYINLVILIQLLWCIVFAVCICSLMAHMARLGFRFMCIYFDFLFTYTYTFATWHGFHYVFIILWLRVFRNFDSVKHTMYSCLYSWTLMMFPPLS